MLGQKGLRPDKSKPKHLLWTLYFLKVYPKQSPGSMGAVNAKTMAWQFIVCIAELADNEVRILYYLLAYLAGGKIKNRTDHLTCHPHH
jgi:hypothetical protein